jgi:hypothetical protein
MILVSDDADDDFTEARGGVQITGSAQDDHKNDRTIKVIIGRNFPETGGQLIAEYMDKDKNTIRTPIKICDPQPVEEKTGRHIKAI